MPPRLPLPPLPNSKNLVSYLPRRKIIEGKEYGNRIQLANPRLCDQYVRELGIRDNEVVVEVFGGVGYMTRALLRGGRGRETQDAEARKLWWEEKKDSMKRRVSQRIKIRRESFYPAWIEAFGDQVPDELVEDLPDDPSLKTPRMVVNVEPNLTTLQRSFDADLTEPLPTVKGGQIADADTTAGLEVCKYDDRLVLAYGDPYFFETVMHVLAHPLVAPLIPPPINPLESPDKALERWNGPPVPITLLLNLPHDALGLHILTSFIGSAFGGSQGKGNYIWTYGRVRLACLLNKAEYDKLTALPGELNFSKTTILVRGLFDVRPVTPKHHVLNAGRNTINVDARDFRKSQSAESIKMLTDQYSKMDLSRTITRAEDFLPVTRAQSDESNPPLARPTLLGVVLEPKKNSLVRWEQRDEWDYVLRHMMVLAAQTVASALPTLGFNAAALQKDIEGDGPFDGRPVNCDMVIRDLDVEDWARIVDVFANWPFKPKVLLLDKTSFTEPTD